MSYLDRFYSKFQEVPESGCWIWVGYLCNKGYGIFHLDGSARKAHRISYDLYRDEIPKGMVIDHICRQRSCVNPDHLRVVTPKENTYAPGSVAPAKINAEKKCCPKCGGDFSRDARGGRICRPCLSKYFKARQRRRSEKGDSSIALSG